MYSMSVANFIRRHVSSDKQTPFIKEFNRFITNSQGINLDLQRIIWDKSVLDSILKGI